MLRDNIEAINSVAVSQLAARAGLLIVDGYIHEHVRGLVKVFVDQLVRSTVTEAEHRRHSSGPGKRILLVHVLAAAARSGDALCGSGGTFDALADASSTARPSLPRGVLPAPRSDLVPSEAAEAAAKEAAAKEAAAAKKKAAAQERAHNPWLLPDDAAEEDTEPPPVSRYVTAASELSDEDEEEDECEPGLLRLPDELLAMVDAQLRASAGGPFAAVRLRGTCSALRRRLPPITGVAAERLT